MRRRLILRILRSLFPHSRVKDLEWDLNGLIGTHTKQAKCKHPYVGDDQGIIFCASCGKINPGGL